MNQYARGWVDGSRAAESETLKIAKLGVALGFVLGAVVGAFLAWWWCR